MDGLVFVILHLYYKEYNGLEYEDDTYYKRKLEP